MALTMLNACMFKDFSEEDEEIVTRAGEAYLTVSLQVTSTGTRADDDERYVLYPYGGEDGNGRQAGINNENDVKNVLVFLYLGNNGINSTNASNITIEKAFYFDDLTLVSSQSNYITWQTEAIALTEENYIDAGTYSVLMWCNVPNAYRDTAIYDEMTLAELRDLIYTGQPWTEDVANASDEAEAIKTYDDFVMSSSSECKIAIDYSTNHPKSDPITCTSTIERLAARIDFAPGTGKTLTSATFNYTDKDSGESGSRSAGYVYTVYGETDYYLGTYTANGDVFVLTDLQAFNCQNSIEYLFRRVTSVSAAGTAITLYFGEQTVDDDNYATNYVLDPLSRKDKTTTFTTGDYTMEYIDWTKEVRETDLVVWFDSDDDGEKEQHDYYILGYTMENTFTSLGTKALDEKGMLTRASMITGVMLGGIYYTAAQWDSVNNCPVNGAVGAYTSFDYYIRHCDPDGKRSIGDIMYHGIVRNNIYYVEIGDIVGNDGEEDFTLTFTLKRRSWAYYLHDEVLM